jgi:hypothetical protein
MTFNDPPPISITSPADLITAIPRLLGTNPKERLVLVGVDDSEVTSSATLELGAVALPGVLAALFLASSRTGSTGVLAVVYTDMAVRTSLLVQPLTAAARWADLELLAALRVTGGRVRPLSADTPAAGRRQAPGRRLRAVE